MTTVQRLYRDRSCLVGAQISCTRVCLYKINAIFGILLVNVYWHLLGPTMTVTWHMDTELGHHKHIFWCKTVAHQVILQKSYDLSYHWVLGEQKDKRSSGGTWKAGHSGKGNSTSEGMRRRRGQCSWNGSTMQTVLNTATFQSTALSSLPSSQSALAPPGPLDSSSTFPSFRLP